MASILERRSTQVETGREAIPTRRALSLHSYLSASQRPDGLSSAGEVALVSFVNCIRRGVSGGHHDPWRLLFGNHKSKSVWDTHPYDGVRHSSQFFPPYHNVSLPRYRRHVQASASNAKSHIHFFYVDFTCSQCRPGNTNSKIDRT